MPTSFSTSSSTMTGSSSSSSSSTEPLPKTSLAANHCSAIIDNTLYTFSADAFQSIALANGSEWQTLPTKNGVMLDGAACVPVDKDLYIVGGYTSDTKNKDYSGLQKYSTSSKSWQSVSVTNNVAANVTKHGAAYIKSRNQIVMFGGGAYPLQDTPSTSTWLIPITEGQTTLAVSGPADVARSAPWVMAWGDDSALIVGGTGPDNTKMWTFTPGDSVSPDPATAFVSLDNFLENALPDKGKGGVSLMQGDDGSRMLYTYDFTADPSRVKKVSVKGANGAAKREVMDMWIRDTASPVESTDSSLTASNWPDVDTENAPSGTRNGASVAYSGDMVVISGGSTDEPLAFFNSRKASWTDSQDVLGGNTDDDDKDDKDDDKITTQTSSSISSTASSTGTPTLESGLDQLSSSTSSAIAAAGGDSGHKLNTVQLLFVILGSILGVAILLACILFFLRRRRRQLHPKPEDDKRHMSFQDRGASFMKEAGGSVGSVNGHMIPLEPPKGGFLQRSKSQHDSWAHVEKEAGIRTSEVQVNSPVNFKDGPTVKAIGGQGVIMSPGATTPPPRLLTNITDQERSSGWSKYFSGNQATDLSAAPRAYSTAQSSIYTQNFPPPKEVHPNPYLHNAGPGVAAGGLGVAASSNRRGSGLSVSSARSGDSFSSGIPESIHDDKRETYWSPVDDEDKRGSGTYWPRPPVASSVYPESPRTQWSAERRDTQLSRYSGPPPQSAAQEGSDNLSWLNLRQG